MTGIMQLELTIAGQTKTWYIKLNKHPDSHSRGILFGH